MITPRTTGIIGVHLWGRPAPVSKLQEIADEHRLKLMFDAAHAFGCSHKNQMIGHFGECEVLSFHATKFFNTFEGGAVVTNSDDLAQAMRLMRNFGFSGYDNVIHPGTNGKMIEVCAAMGLVNLDHIDSAVEANRHSHQLYTELLSPFPGLNVLPYDEAERNNFQYVVLEVGVECQINRDDLVAALHAENVLARKYFWPGCHKMKPYRDLFPHAGLLLANTRTVAERVIVLPTGPSLHVDAIKEICNVITFCATPRN
jgi:dTDP-4-amino-4,6-dideoxygalactose transaminase